MPARKVAILVSLVHAITHVGMISIALSWGWPLLLDWQSYYRLSFVDIVFKNWAAEAKSYSNIARRLMLVLDEGLSVLVIRRLVLNEASNAMPPQVLTSLTLCLLRRHDLLQCLILQWGKKPETFSQKSWVRVTLFWTTRVAEGGLVQQGVCTRLLIWIA